LTRHRRLLALLALLLSFSMVAAACGDDDEGGGGEAADTTDDGATDDATDDASDEGTDEGDDEGTDDGGEVSEGGRLVLGAEQEAECADWIASCAGASWGYWTMNVNTMPRTFDAVKDGEDWVYEPNILLDGEPELETDPQQVVTYQISEDAVWNDGEPITSSDFKYTWEQITTGKDIYDTTGYANIEDVDDSDPKVAVVTFETPFAGWKGLFGGGYGIFPSHILEGENRSRMMNDGYDFSGGPWIIEEWARGESITLVPNENFWGEVPKLDEVIFQFISDTSAEFQAYQGGEVEMIYPQPQIDVVEQISGGSLPGNSEFSDQTGNIEALWMNNAEFPLDSLAVRQAIGYALDRDAIVENLFGGLDITEASNSLNPPILSSFTDVDAFADYTQDLDQVDELMTGDGWEKGGDGVWAKDGERAVIEFKTTTGNARRELTQEIVQEQLGAAGFEITIDNQEAGDLFGSQLPAGEFQMALYAQVLTAIDPSLCNIFCSKNIPSEENDFSGQNWTRTEVPEMDPLLETVDNSLDDDERAEAQREADGIMAENMVSLPLDPLPNILLWSDNIEGPVQDNPILGPFYNMNEWGLAG
jgi:peptide/nickel transport system substrate-binding protein